MRKLPAAVAAVPLAALLAVAETSAATESQVTLPHMAESAGVKVETELSQAEARELLKVFAAHRAWSARALAPIMEPPTAANLRVILFSDQARYLAATSDFAHSLGSNGGFYDGAANTVYSFREGNSLGLLLHELSHAMMGEAFEDRVFERYRRSGWPVWLDEGVAEVLAAATLRREGRGFSLRAEPAVKLGALVDDGGRVSLPMSVGAIMSADMLAYRGPRLDAYYGMAHALVHTLAQRPTQLRSLLSDLRSGRNPSRAVGRLVSSLGGPETLERMLTHAVGTAMASAWEQPRRLAGREDTIWNWIKVGEGDVKVSNGLHLAGAPEGAVGPLLLRQVPPLHAASVRLECDVRRGGLELLLSTSPTRVDHASFRIALSQSKLQISPTGPIGTGRPIEMPLPPGADPARLAVEVRLDRQGGKVRIDDKEILVCGPAGGPLRGLGIGRLSGEVRTSPVLVAPVVRTLPAGPGPKARGRQQGGKGL
jgi:hypothetical protein